jgi:hypothetical protein
MKRKEGSTMPSPRDEGTRAAAKLEPDIHRHIDRVGAGQNLRDRQRRQILLVAHPAAGLDDFAMDPGGCSAAEGTQGDLQEAQKDRAEGRCCGGKGGAWGHFSSSARIRGLSIVLII